MSNNVFANDLEIACKAADGMSNAAFPDPCFTPPPPNGGWVLVPYPNTAFAKDLANGSTSVFISGLQVAKKDVSFIQTSTGNEPAAGPMGKKTGVKKGKAYFTSWSMDVKVEGLNVCRHTDSMTHNHASWPGNTSDWTAYDVVSTGLEVTEIYEKFDEMQQDIDKLKKIPGEIEALKEGELTTSKVADAQEIIAKANPCLSAKRCLLVPFKEKGAGPKRGNKGCCGGQTKHHVIPKGQFKSEAAENAPNTSDCPGYDADDAPCICSEGTSHSLGGSHEKLHTALEPKIEKGADANGQLSYGQSRDMSVKATREVAPNCSKACLKAQLDKYHKKACNQQGDNFKLRAASAKSGTTYSNVPTVNTNTNIGG
jgi:hypothetical protein